MGNVKKFLKYFLPMIALPILSSYISILHTVTTNRLGVAAVAARSSFLSANNISSTILSLLAIAGLAIAAILGEKGKVRTGKMLHLIVLLAYASVLIITVAIYLFLPQAPLSMMTASAEVFAMGTAYGRAFALPILLVAVIATLPSQFSGKHSFILVMSLGAGLLALCSFTGLILISVFKLGITGSGIVDGLGFAVSSVMPFLMVPVKRYANAFAPSIPE